MSGHEVPGPERDAMAEGQSGMPYPESRKPPGGSRDGHHNQDPGELRHAVRRAAPQRNVALRGPEVLPATGTGWTRPVSPGVRCLPCIRRPPP